MSINKKITYQCIALAGMAQAIRVVQNIAWKGNTNETDFKSVLCSVLTIDAPSAAAVYQGSFEVSSGLRIIQQQLNPQHNDKDPEFVNLAINIINLQTQLQNNNHLLQKLSEKTRQLASQFDPAEIYCDDDVFEELIDGCSEAYKQTLSQLASRIQVRGEPKYLKQTQNQHRVRAALLTAIRACFLWRQCGGSRWHFLFKKKILLENIQHLISNPLRE